MPKDGKPRILPVVSLSAEYLTMGYLLRRNILAYKAPPNNEGYDLICTHPDPKQVTRQIRVQVKSRYQTDCDRAFPVKKKTFGAFDYLIVVFLNIGHFYRKHRPTDPPNAPQFYTLPRAWIAEHHHKTKSGWEKVLTKQVTEELEQYRDDRGFELIARELRVEHPGRNAPWPDLTSGHRARAAHGSSPT